MKPSPREWFRKKKPIQKKDLETLKVALAKLRAAQEGLLKTLREGR